VKISTVQWVLLASDLLLELALLFTVVRNRDRLRLPSLAWLAAFLLARSSFLAYLIISEAPVVIYGWVYWAGQGVQFVLVLVVILAFWKTALGRYQGIWMAGRVLGFAGLGALLVGVAAHRYVMQNDAAYSPPFENWIQHILQVLNGAASLTQATILLAFFALLGALRFRVPAIVRRLALGWFLYALVRVCLYGLAVLSGPSQIFNIGISVAFTAVLIHWTLSVWRATAEEVEVGPVLVLRASPEEIASRMEGLNASLLKLLKV
jgi:type IV secretory pathway VirB2 component (pilin)